MPRYDDTISVDLYICKLPKFQSSKRNCPTHSFEYPHTGFSLRRPAAVIKRSQAALPKGTVPVSSCECLHSSWNRYRAFQNLKIPFKTNKQWT